MSKPKKWKYPQTKKVEKFKKYKKSTEMKVIQSTFSVVKTKIQRIE